MALLAPAGSRRRSQLQGTAARGCTAPWWRAAVVAGLPLACAHNAGNCPSDHAGAVAEVRSLRVHPVAETPWGPGPENTVRVAHLYGDPARPGLFVQRMEMPAGTVTPPHTHTHDELITVLTGSIYIGLGDTVDSHAAREVTAGGMVVIPAHAHHFGGSADGALLQVQGVGPFEMNWLPAPATHWQGEASPQSPGCTPEPDPP